MFVWGTCITFIWPLIHWVDGSWTVCFNLFLNLENWISNLKRKHAILHILDLFLHSNETYPYLLLSILWPDIVLLSHFVHPSDNGRSLVIYIEVPVRPFPKHLQKWGTRGILWHHKSMMSQLQRWTNTTLCPYSLGHAMNRKDSWNHIYICIYNKTRL